MSASTHLKAVGSRKQQLGSENEERPLHCAVTLCCASARCTHLHSQQICSAAESPEEDILPVTFLLLRAIC